MLKSFLGFELVQNQTQKKKERKKASPLACTFTRVLLGIVAGVVVLCLPLSAFGIDGLTIVEKRVIALFCFAAIMWITEGIPSWSTSVAIVVILLFVTSDSSLSLVVHQENPLFGTLISHRKLMACFADPIIMLFIGGFILAIAATKSGLDIKLAKILLKPFGTKSENVLLGFILVTGLFSMFLSNTATANLLLPILALAGMSAFAHLAPYGGVATMLIGVALGSSLAMVLPISTPPNALAHATGYIELKDMIKIGIVMGVTGLVLGYLLLIFAGKTGLM